MEEESCGMLMETFTKANGWTIELTVTELTSMPMGQFTKENGSKTNKKAQARKLGRTEHSMKETTLMARSTAEENLDSQMVLFMKENLSIMK